MSAAAGAAPQPSGDQALSQGAVVKLRLVIKGRSIVCTGKIARRFEEDKTVFCGIAFMDLSAHDMSELSLSLYGEEEDTPTGGSEHGLG